MLPNTNGKHAQLLAERLLQHVRSHIFEIKKKKIQITISQGIASTSADHEKRVDNLLEHAHQAWTVAKQQGGNQVVNWHSYHPLRQS
jgi:GGDEF domain-containing protein